MTTELSTPARPATVAIVGRPNVGKSALFNRLIGRRLAIVAEEAGVTRDRLYALASWRARDFVLVDTAGFDPEGGSDEIATQTRAQAEIAAEEADLVVIVVDAQAGLSPLDEEVVRLVRRRRKATLVVANKAESERARSAIAGEFARLGFGTPLAVSAIHGEGTGDLLDAIVTALPPQGEGEPQAGELAIAIIGRPNVGKSSLLNALAGERRAIVSEVAGTTRDAVDTVIARNGRSWRLIDTAGIWRRPRHHGALEYYASLRSLAALARCQLAILVIDATAGILEGDRRLAALALEEHKALVVAANKWDLALEQEGEFSQGELTRIIHEQLPFADFAPVTFLSALTGRRLGRLLPLIERVAENRERRIATGPLNALVRDAIYAHPPPARGGKPLRIYYAAQVAVAPPRFIFHCNDPELVTPAYRRFLEGTLRAAADFEGVPLVFDFRPRGEHDQG
ncbi:MAG: ribosome biogenesis GTPase Der [Vulcanimicrobiaceae bacterium]